MNKPELIGYREFARRDKCDEKLVRRAVREGRLPASADGKIDAALVASPWRRGNLASADTVRTLLPGETPEEAAQRVVSTAVTIPAYGVSLAKKEFYAAELKAIEHDLRVGTVVLVADAMQIIEGQLGAVRTRLLAIPSSCSAQVQRLRTTPEIAACLTDAIRAALVDLTGDTLPAPG